MRQFVFLRPHGPGAFVRFGERMAPGTDPELPLELGDARLCHPWRVLYASDANIEAWLPYWCNAFGPVLYRLILCDRNWVWETHARETDVRLRNGECGKEPWWNRLPGSPRPVPNWWRDAPDSGLPLARVLDIPPKSVEFTAIDTLDQRGLLVETHPVRYRVRIPVAPTV